jgi:hypothetical protein
LLGPTLEADNAMLTSRIAAERMDERIVLFVLDIVCVCVPMSST